MPKTRARKPAARSSKARKPTTRRSKKKQPSGKLAVYLLLTVGVFALIYWLAKPVLTGESSRQQDKEQVSKAEKHHKKSKLKEGKTETVKAEDIAPSDVKHAIMLAMQKLGVDANLVKTKDTADGYSYQIPIDRSRLDLTFANMIIKGEVEKAKGLLISGREAAGRQTLVFSDAARKLKYNVELFYKARDKDAPVVSGNRVMAIVVDDFGNIKGDLLQGFIKTNPNVCFAIMPDTPQAGRTMKEAVAAGHECLIHAPMEPVNYPRENPGDNAIFLQDSAGGVAHKMDRYISQLPQCKGVNNHMGSMATADETTMRALMPVLRKQGLYFLDSRTIASSVAYNIAQKNMIPAYKRDVFIDEPDLSAGNLDKRIAECIALAGSKPYVITIMHCHTPQHLSYLTQFVAKAKANGFNIVPVSQLGAYKLPEIQ